MAEIQPFDPVRIVTALAKHRVAYVMIGALAARLQGFPRLTADIDITPERERKNLNRLAATLRELDARIYVEQVPEGLPFEYDGKSLERANVWNLVTIAGRIDIAFEPSGTKGYHDLIRSAERIAAFGTELQVASLSDIIRSKVAADRPQDREDVPLLRAVMKKAKRDAKGS